MDRMMRRIKILLDLVKFEHTIFALPFAYMGVVLAQYRIPEFRIWFWVTLAMMGARTAAMGLNRLIDRDIDARNPRTQNRHIPQGLVKPLSVWVMVGLSLLLLLYSAWALNPLCFYLSPLAVLLLWFYSYTKRFTWMAHFVLGIVEAAAPIGGWIAVTGSLSWPPLLIGAGLIFWLAGFDILYSLQDYEFDKKSGLYSIPAQFGIQNALFISSGLHLLTMLFFLFAGLALHSGIWYWLGTGLIAGLLIYEHAILHPRDLSRLNQAFFTVNGWVSVVLFMGSLLDVIL